MGCCQLLRFVRSELVEKEGLLPPVKPLTIPCALETPIPYWLGASICAAVSAALRAVVAKLRTPNLNIVVVDWIRGPIGGGFFLDVAISLSLPGDSAWVAGPTALLRFSLTAR
jgi:hypothetical protein